MNGLTEIWTSMNSSVKDLQEQTKASLLSMWTKVNATKMELLQNVRIFFLLDYQC